MTDRHTITYDDLDWDRLWQNARQQKGWRSKGAASWDSRSASFASRNRNSAFASLLLSHLPLGPEMTVLDVGCGPGTLALPMARHCARVTAIDFSSEMLRLLDDQAKADGIDNIRTVRCAWEDDWDAFGIGVHDIALAARSLGVENLRSALTKLIRHGRKYVVIVDRILPTPFDPQAFAAIGRPLRSGPDYIYTLNMLYSMGIHPNTTVLQLEKEVTFGSLEEACAHYAWMFHELSHEEEDKLKNYIRHISSMASNGAITINRAHPPRWLLIWWKTETI